MKKLLLLTALVVATQAESSQYVFRYGGTKAGSSLTVKLYSSWQGGRPFETVTLDAFANKKRTVGTTNNLDHIEVIDDGNGKRYQFSFANNKDLQKLQIAAPIDLTLVVYPKGTILVKNNETNAKVELALKKQSN